MQTHLQPCWRNTAGGEHPTVVKSIVTAKKNGNAAMDIHDSWSQVENGREQVQRYP